MDGVCESNRDDVPPSNLLACGMDGAFQSLACGMDEGDELNRGDVPPSNFLACAMDGAFQSLGGGMDEGDELNRGEARLHKDPSVYAMVPAFSLAWEPPMVWALPLAWALKSLVGAFWSP